MKSKFGNITFAEGYNQPFAEFKQSFEASADFKKIPHLERDAAMQAVHARVLEDTKEWAKDKKTRKGTRNINIAMSEIKANAAKELQKQIEASASNDKPKDDGNTTNTKGKGGNAKP